MNLVHIEITADPITPAKTRTDPAGNAKIVPAKQNAYLHQGETYPMGFKLAVPDTGPLRPGRYLIAGACFMQGKFGPELISSRMELVPFEEAAKLLTDSAKLKAA